MSDQTLAIWHLSKDEPAVADAIVSALRRFIHFHQTRGKLLRSLRTP